MVCTQLRDEMTSQFNTMKRHKTNSKSKERNKNKIWDTKSYKTWACIVTCYHSINKGLCIEPLNNTRKGSA